MSAATDAADAGLLGPEAAAFDRLESARGDRPLARLAAAWRRGRLSHALVLGGPRGSGKRHAAVRLAQLLACERPTELAPCGRCASCQRTEHGLDPDTWLLEPSFDEKRKVRREEISIEQVRGVQEKLTFTSAGRRRVVLVDPADRLSIVAQEAMLKLLEEPPAGVTLLLVTSRPSFLKPTVRSRCQLVRFPPPSPDDVAAVLRAEGRTEEHARLAAALAGGDLRRALEMDVDVAAEQWIVAARELYELLGSKGESKARDLALKVAPKKGSEEAEAATPVAEWLDLATRILRDTLIAGTTSGAGDLASRLTHPAGLKAATALATRLAPDDAARAMDEIARARDDLALHVNPRVVMTSLLLTLHGLRTVG